MENTMDARNFNGIIARAMKLKYCYGVKDRLDWINECISNAEKYEHMYNTCDEDDKHKFLNFMSRYLNAYTDAVCELGESLPRLAFEYAESNSSSLHFMDDDKFENMSNACCEYVESRKLICIACPCSNECDKRYFDHLFGNDIEKEIRLCTKLEVRKFITDYERKEDKQA